MSFYHFLHSDAAKATFANNEAANFSTPIDHIQQLDGQWEVGVSQLVYSNCLYTLNHEIITIEEKLTSAYQFEKGCRVNIPVCEEREQSSVQKHIYNFLNKACEHIATFTPLRTKIVTYRHQVDKDWIVALSPSLKRQLGYSTNVLTSDDTYPSKYVNKDIVYSAGEFYVDLIPKNDGTLIKKIVFKEKNQDLTIDSLVKKFNFLMRRDGRQVATLEMVDTTVLTLNKTSNDDIVIVFSKHFQEFLENRLSAIHGKQREQGIRFDSTNQYSNEWAVSLYRKGEVIISESMINKTTKRKEFLPSIIHSIPEGVQHLNQVIDDERITFHQEENILSLEVGGKDIQVTMDDTLMDILGFDQNTFISNSITKASAPMSLTRRINYFQIYSNVGIDMRIGDVEAPLLTMIPFNPKYCNTLSERTFKKVNYIPLKSNYISHIDISIYDDAGVLVPFHKDVVTSIVLHFKLKT